MNTYLVYLSYTPEQDYAEDVHTMIGKIEINSYNEAVELLKSKLGAVYEYACNHNKQTTGYYYVQNASFDVVDLNNISHI